MSFSPDAEDRHAPRSRIRAAEVRRRVLDAALERVESIGLTIGFEHIVMDDLIREAGVPRSSTYRLWDSKDAFITDLLKEIAAETSNKLADDETLELSERILYANLDRLENEDDRRRVMYEVIRVALEHNYRAVIASVAWQSYVGLSATLLSHLEWSARDEIERALRDGSDSFIERMAAFHAWFSTILGYRLRAEWKGDYRPYAVVISAVVEGLGLRHLGNPGLVDATYAGPATITSDDPEWALPAIALVAILERFLEPDPDYDAAATVAALRERAAAAETAASEPGEAEPGETEAGEAEPGEDDRGAADAGEAGPASELVGEHDPAEPVPGAPLEGGAGRLDQAGEEHR